jgi:hypothetical protein
MGLKPLSLGLVAVAYFAFAAPPPVVLSVPLIPQQAEKLCWAACTRMVMKKVENTLDTRQCALVDTVYGASRHCCDASNPNGGPNANQLLSGPCNVPAWPPITHFHKQGTAAFWQRDSLVGKLPWANAKALLNAGQPYIFSLAYLTSEHGVRNGVVHAMVAYGYKYIENASGTIVDSALIVWDPWGPGPTPAGLGTGDAYWMTYAAYDYGTNPFNGAWYGDGPSWSNVH